MFRPIRFPDVKRLAAQQQIDRLGKPLLNNGSGRFVDIAEKPSFILETVLGRRLYDATSVINSDAISFLIDFVSLPTLLALLPGSSRATPGCRRVLVLRGSKQTFRPACLRSYFVFM